MLLSTKKQVLDTFHDISIFKALKQSALIIKSKKRYFFKKQNWFHIIDLLILQEHIFLRIIANEEYIE